MTQNMTDRRINRNSSIELIKLIAVFLIICSSSLPYGVTYNGGYDAVYVNLNCTDFSATHIVFTLFRWFGQIGDTLFIVCSAWFLCDSGSVKLNKALKMFSDSWVISIIGLILAMLTLSPEMSETIKSLFPVTFQLNWFVGCYIIYYLIHPLLNKAVEDLEYGSFKRLVLILFIAYSIIGTALQKYYYTNLVAFICIHYFVTFYKRFGREKLHRTKDLKIIAISGIIIIGWIICINLLGSRIEVLSTKNLFGCIFINPVIVLMGIAVLDLAISKDFHNRTINTASSYSLLIYLFHSNYFWLTYGKYWLLGRMVNCGLGILGAVLILIAVYAVTTLFLSAIYEKSLGQLTATISGKLSSRLLQ